MVDEEKIIFILKSSKSPLGEGDIKEKLGINSNIRPTLVKMCVQQKIKRAKKFDQKKHVALWRYYLD